jgi:hypothetical protein
MNKVRHIVKNYEITGFEIFPADDDYAKSAAGMLYEKCGLIPIDRDLTVHMCWKTFGEYRLCPTCCGGPRMQLVRGLVYVAEYKKIAGYANKNQDKAIQSAKLLYARSSR